MSGQFDRIAVWNEDGIGVIVINNGKLNLIDGDLLNQLSSALTIASSDSNLKWIALSGAGDEFFSAGVNWSNVGSDYDSVSELVNSIKTLASIMVTVDKPVITILNGSAAGLGLELALLSDLLIAPTDAKLCNPEGGLGIPMMLGAPIILKSMPRLRAIQLIGGGEIDAAEAGQLGLVHAVLPRGNLFGDAKSIILNTRIDRYTKSLIHRDMDQIIRGMNPSLMEPLLSKCRGVGRDEMISKLNAARSRCAPRRGSQ
ncbi:hypothetical protein GCM10007981_05460 [Thermocladium modestius]|uniref:Enoyl-CoA hydratase n=1 Tax=Thermocladium modestius TaxID=62609 RepID=A0A830GTG9_9CREN|nr:enoyl-CoA hydratase/isomerase family protein [Thermocladium modestius]GGP19902.1 hypothetical protein GCM10007981_05460 [Thermocladium modestius]